MKAYFSEYNTINTTKGKSKFSVDSPIVQKILGAILALVGLTSMFLMEDATCGLMLIIMGIARVLIDDDRDL